MRVSTGRRAEQLDRATALEPFFRLAPSVLPGITGNMNAAFKRFDMTHLDTGHVMYPMLHSM